MEKTVMQVEGLSKQYRLGIVGTGTISHDLNRWWYKMRGKEDPYLKIGEENDRSIKGSSDYVWALRDVNFNVKEGEVLGIIGKNGAGKSTLLKLLSRTTSPTTGSIKIKGRIASLLEVGTGFHPELSGRDNIYLNGAILGMTRQEVSRKFDEIVDFAGVDRYVDTPVKRYSSGMYVRLAFAVAAHLEPDILIVDEVLAVGDAEFQQKAIGKMQDVSRGDGRTVLFVSHNMGSIKSLCNSGIILRNGYIDYINDDIEKVITKYYEKDRSLSPIDIDKRADRQGNQSLRIKSLKILNSIDGNQIQLGKQLGFVIEYNAMLSSFSGKLLISINNYEGECLVFLDSSTIKDFPPVLNGSGQIEIKLSPDFGLPPGKYSLNIAFFVNDAMADYMQNVLILNVVDGLFFEGGKIPVGKSLCYVQQKWSYHAI